MFGPHPPIPTFILGQEARPTKALGKARALQLHVYTHRFRAHTRIILLCVLLVTLVVTLFFHRY